MASLSEEKSRIGGKEDWHSIDKKRSEALDIICDKG